MGREHGAALSSLGNLRVPFVSGKQPGAVAGRQNGVVQAVGHRREKDHFSAVGGKLFHISNRIGSHSGSSCDDGERGGITFRIGIGHADGAKRPLSPETEPEGD